MTKIKLRYVKRYRDRHGLLRFYFRRKGQRAIPLPGLPGSKPFMAAYNAALGNTEAPASNGRTLGDLFARYRASPAWPKNPSTQRTYRQAMKPIEAKDGHRSAVDLPADKAAKLIEEIGETRPGMANLTRSVLRAAFDYAIKLKWRYDNPFAGIQSYETGTHHTWTDAQIDAFIRRWPLGTRERMAFDLFYYTAQRISDVAKAARSDIRPGDKAAPHGRLYVKQQKTGVELLIPVHPGLRASMNAYGIHGPNLIARLDGKPISIKMLRVLMVDAIAAAELPKECVPHGIRKAVLRTLAELDVSSKGIASLSGHKTLKEIERYTEAADQGRMAITAIAALPDRTVNARP